MKKQTLFNVIIYIVVALILFSHIGLSNKVDHIGTAVVSLGSSLNKNLTQQSEVLEQYENRWEDQLTFNEEVTRILGGLR